MKYRRERKRERYGEGERKRGGREIMMKERKGKEREEKREKERRRFLVCCFLCAGNSDRDQGPRSPHKLGEKHGSSIVGCSLETQLEV